jgi:hypothetical protein
VEEQLKRCPHCERWLPLGCFGKDQSTPDKLKYWCKECLNASSKKYKQNHKQEMDEYNHRYYNNNPEYWQKHHKQHPEQVKKAQEKYKENNFEHYKKYHQNYKQTNKEKIKLQHYAYYQTEAGKMSARNAAHKRRILLLNTPPHLVLSTTEEAKFYKEPNCAYCKCLLTEPVGKIYCPTDRTIDHVVPLSKKGQHSANNVVPCCKHCNLSKGNKDADLWLKEKITHARICQNTQRREEMGRSQNHCRETI